MSSGGTRGLAFLFGVVAALLLIVAAIVDFVGGFVFLAFGSGGHAFGVWSRSVVEVVVGILVGAFAVFGRAGDRERSVGAGAILVVLAVAGWFVLGLGGEILALLATIFALIGGILFLVSER